jgi:hypothetical protein
MEGAMPPPPKRNPARRNTSTTKSTLTSDHDVEAPALPERDWHPMTEKWWRDVWASPMAPEYDGSDHHGLFILAALVDKFWTDPSATLAGEIRLQRQCFGLTPIDRRRLQWEIERTEEAQDKGRKRRTKVEKPEEGKPDPRAVLRSVS